MLTLSHRIFALNLEKSASPPTKKSKEEVSDKDLEPAKKPKDNGKSAPSKTAEKGKLCPCLLF